MHAYSYYWVQFVSNTEAKSATDVSTQWNTSQSGISSSSGETRCHRPKPSESMETNDYEIAMHM